jgi:SARP family transcriptional regulator, regulator of embCAB operon
LSRDQDVWIQVCGPLVVRLGDERVENDLPGRQGRQIAAYLIVNRARTVTRDELLDALWWRDQPEGASGTLSTLLSRTRRVLGEDRLRGKSELRLVLPPDAWVDIEVAAQAVHVAESAVAQRDFRRAWAPARTALNAAKRGFLPGHDAPWIDQRRDDVANIHVRALEAIAQAGLGLRGTELASVERAARSLIVVAPFRESGYRYLMEYFAARGESAEALQVYERLRRLLSEELGTAPGPSLQQLHSELLGRS